MDESSDFSLVSDNRGGAATWWTWGILQTYGFQVLVALVLCAITLFRRELSCNNGYHDHDRVAQNVNSEEVDSSVKEKEEKKANLRGGAKRGRGRTGSFGEKNDSHVALLERDSFGLSFAPTISFITFLCRAIYIIGMYPLRRLWFLMVRFKNILGQRVNKMVASFLNPTALDPNSVEGRRSSYEKRTESGDSLGQALTDKWQECRLNGFHVDSYSNLLTLAIGKNNEDESSSHEKSMSLDQYQIHSLPSELAYAVLSFLSVSDVLQFGMVSKASHNLVSSPRIAHEFWNRLCLRDFDGLLRWPVAQLRFKESQQRSTRSLRKEQGGVLSETYAAREGEEDEPNAPKVARTAASSDMVALISKWHKCLTQSDNEGKKVAVHELYFLLLECWLPWSVALRNTTQDCLVGLHGAVYDITAFLPHHPGSIETLLVHAGSDATEMFETVRHSSRARSLGNGFCVMVPLPDPPRMNRLREHYLPAKGRHEYLKDNLNEFCPFNMIRRSLRSFLSSKRKIYETRAREKLNQEAEVIVGDTVHCFYDPFIETWCSWYTSLTLNGELEPVMTYFDG